MRILVESRHTFFKRLSLCVINRGGLKHKERDMLTILAVRQLINYCNIHFATKLKLHNQFDQIDKVLAKKLTSELKTYTPTFSLLHKMFYDKAKISAPMVAEKHFNYFK